eukprot:6218425-Amphidinium_carterae.1
MERDEEHGGKLPCDWGNAPEGLGTETTSNATTDPTDSDLAGRSIVRHHSAREASDGPPMVTVGGKQIGRWMQSLGDGDILLDLQSRERTLH